MLNTSKIKFASMFLTLILAITTLVACQSAPASNQLTLFVAAGLQKPMDATIEGFKQETKAEITVSYASTGSLYTQIQQGQPCDLYFTADWIYNEKMEKELNLVDTNYKFLNDNVVLIVSKSAASKVTSVNDLVKSGVAVAVAVEEAPIGAYSVKALKILGIWDQMNTIGTVKARPATVNQVALMVQQDQVDAGLVYSSTAHGVSLEPVYVFGTDLTGEVVFGAVVVKNGNVKLAKEFYDYAYEHASEFVKYGWQICK